MEAKVYTAAQLAEIVGASAIKGNPEAEVSGVDSLRLAKENNIPYITPLMGEKVDLTGKELSQKEWWKKSGKQ